MANLERLRELIRGSAGRSAGAPAPAPPRELTYEPVDHTGLPLPTHHELPSLAGAQWLDTPAGRCVVVDRVFESDDWHGRWQVGSAALRNEDLSGVRDIEKTGMSPFFLDLETTGLSGGAGTVAFLVGCGFFEDGHFRTRQFLLQGFSAERAMLHGVTQVLADQGCLVTYNGRTFDLPVMETRWLFHRLTPPWSELAHLDMLHLSRRLWRGRMDDGDASCRLVLLERDLFGVERVGDVPGFEIPGRYFDYVRYGNASVLEPVLHHNRLDLLSLAMVTARAMRLIREGLDAAADAQECFALGRELLQRGDGPRAESCLRAVLDRVDATETLKAEARFFLARWLRRSRRYEEAAEVWRALVASRMTPYVIRREAQKALAVHYEHRARDLDSAQQWAFEALATERDVRGREEVRYRLDRLKRKIARKTEGGPETAWLID